jgi:CRISPR/Cas system CSM-associated protein Csm4 (group 5 of RAMP superfamily)
MQWHDMNVFLCLTQADIAIPRRTRMISSSLFFVFCLAGLYWTDYLEANIPQTEEQKQRMENIKKIKFPSRADFEEARQQADRAKAMGKADPKKLDVENSDSWQPKVNFVPVKNVRAKKEQEGTIER